MVGYRVCIHLFRVVWIELSQDTAKSQGILDPVLFVAC